MPPKFLCHGSVSLDTPVLGMCNSTVVRLHNGGVFTTAGSINEKKIENINNLLHASAATASS